MSTSVPTQPDRFVHLAYEYRYLALASAAYNMFGPPGEATKANQDANKLLPGIGALVQDSLLMHARVLIEFYCKDPNSNPTDIVLANFGITSPNNVTRLQEYWHEIEVHALHLTIWRDPDYRTTHNTSNRGQARQRPIDWNNEIPVIMDLLFWALDQISDRSTKWGEPFHKLYQSATSLRSDPFAVWPKELGGKSDVTAYLAELGLT